jgi:DNA-binding PadR family transcriptional regulator
MPNEPHARSRTESHGQPGEPGEFLPLKSIWLQILLAVAGGHRHGYAIRQEVEERTDGRVKLWPATLYGALGSLREAGLLEELEEAADVAGDDPRRRYYALTPLGSAVLAAEVDRLEELVALARSRRVAGEYGGA